MCRMLLAIGNVSLPPLVEAMKLMALDQTAIHERNEKTGLGTWTHPDGWGIASTKAPPQKREHFALMKSKKAIFNDDATATLPQRVTFSLLHVRARSIGNVEIENTHPFYRQIGTEEFLFCHNGTIRERLPMPPPEFQPLGTTDSENIFMLILSHLAQEKSSEERYVHALRAVTKQLPAEMDSNFIFCTKEKSYITSFHNKYPRYLQLQIGTARDLTVISSEKIGTIPQLSWEKFPETAILEIEHATRKTRVIPR
ncbi:class II glutamine amidotransferase [Candidatus Woesearchaeota archaeon]|nr:class II glutamine amidotransferase [Candidatus Woesearchaeota archaeon]